MKFDFLFLYVLITTEENYTPLETNLETGFGIQRQTSGVCGLSNSFQIVLEKFLEATDSDKTQLHISVFGTSSFYSPNKEHAFNNANYKDTNILNYYFIFVII